MPQSDRNEFLEIIDDTAVNIFKIKITKTKNLKNRVDLIKVYPIETTSKNLMSLVTFIDSQIEYKSPFSLAFLLLASFFTFFIPLLVYFVKNKIETGVFLDYTTSLNKAFFFRLKEIKNQITFLAEEPDVKEKVNSYVKSIYRKRAINRFYSIFVTIFITIPAISLIYACRSC